MFSASHSVFLLLQLHPRDDSSCFEKKERDNMMTKEHFMTSNMGTIKLQPLLLVIDSGWR